MTIHQRCGGEVYNPPPKDHDCDEWSGKVRGDGGEAMVVCTACEYHK